MYFYFFCDFPAVIKFQGIIFGTVDCSVKFCDLKKPYPLTEICPLMNKGEPIAFFPDENFINSPPENVMVTDLKGGYFLRFGKTKVAEKFRVLAQEKYRDAAITAFYENGCKISLETNTGFFAETLDFLPLSVNFTRGENDNRDLIFALFDCGDKKILNVYGIKEPALLFCGETDGFTLTATGFTVTEKLKDIAKHVVVREYAADGGKLRKIAVKVTADEKFDREKLPDRLLPYAFCEEFLCGGNFKFYLSSGVKENADKLGGYLGEFSGVTPPPIFRNYREIGLIRKIAERRYSVDYYVFDIADGKISNIEKV